MTTLIELGERDNQDVIDELLQPLTGRFVIDAGCGDLTLARHLAGLGAAVLGIDPDPIQAAKNRDAEVTPNVGFHQTTADALPVEPSAVDGVVFNYSLHHVPAQDYPSVFGEVKRVLKPDGFLLVVEPVAEGELNTVMSLFHDEAVVREQAQQALAQFVLPGFETSQHLGWYHHVQYRDWTHFADYYASRSFNANYGEADVRAPRVRSLFEQLGQPLNYRFRVPVRALIARRPMSAA